MKIGKKIKELRTLCNLTQEELASRTELTKGYISQLENDLAEPSVSTLHDIVSALGTNMSEFFMDEKQTQIVFTGDDYFIKENDGYTIKWLVPNAQKNEMEPILVSINPNFFKKSFTSKRLAVIWILSFAWKVKFPVGINTSSPR